MAGNILRNPFSQATNNGPVNADTQGRRSPMDGRPPNNNNNSNNNNNNNNNNINDPNNYNNNNDDQNNGDIDPATGKKKVQASDDPFADLSNLWDPTPVDKDNPPAEFAGYLTKIDPKQLTDHIGKMDFTKSITPEQKVALAAGGEASVQVMMDLMNSVGRQSFQAAFTSANKMTESGLTAAEKRFMTELVPGSVKDVMLDNSLTADNPMMKDPQFAPLVKGITAQFRNKFPKASPGELQQGVTKYFDGLLEKMTKAKTPKDVNTPTNADLLKKGSGEADWDAWADETINLAQGGGNEIQL